jgi:mono/diheme cytochrome c family protein
MNWFQANYKIVTFLFSGLVLSGISVFNFQENETYSKNDALVRYGEYVYERENCAQCHTLHLNENPDLVSLDGLGGKYKDGWLVLLMEEPQYLIPDTKMPSHKHLFEQALSTEIGENKLHFSKNDWTQLVIDAEKEYQLLSDDYRLFFDLPKQEPIKLQPKTEIVALIRYLQQIPKSEAFQIQEAIEIEKEKQLIAEMELLLNNPNGILYQELKNPTKIKLGENQYHSLCIVCHGQYGKGSIGPNLTDDYWIYGGSDQEIAKVIALGGEPGKGMVSYSSILKPEEIGQLLAYIKSLKGLKFKDAKAPQGSKYKGKS